MGDSFPDIPEERLKAFASSLDIKLSDIHAFLKRTGWEQAICEVCQNDNFTLDVLGDVPAPVMLPAAATMMVETDPEAVWKRESGTLSKIWSL